MAEGGAGRNPDVLGGPDGLTLALSLREVRVYRSSLARSGSHPGWYVVSVGLESVAAAILPAVEGGILPAGPEVRNGGAFPKPDTHAGGHDARPYGTQDAHRVQNFVPYGTRFCTRCEQTGMSVAKQVPWLLSRVASFRPRTPTVFRPKAQGWRQRLPWVNQKRKQP